MILLSISGCLNAAQPSQIKFCSDCPMQCLQVSCAQFRADHYLQPFVLLPSPKSKGVIHFYPEE